MNFLPSVLKRQWKGKKIMMILLFLFVFFNVFPLFGILFSHENSNAGIIQTVSAESQNATNTTNAKKDFKPQTVNQFLRGRDGNGNENALMQNISNWASTIIAVFTPIIAMVVKFIGSLMGDAYIFGNNNAGPESFNIHCKDERATLSDGSAKQG